MHGMHACMEMEGVCFVNGTGETHWTRELDTVTAVLLVVLTKPLSTAVGLGEIGCFASANDKTPLKTDPPRISLQTDSFRKKVYKSSPHMSFCLELLV